MTNTNYDRRAFLCRSVQAGAGFHLARAEATTEGQKTECDKSQRAPPRTETPRAFNGLYEGPYTDHIAFPLGGIGAGMICLEGTGALSKFSLRHRPDLESEHRVFSAIAVKGTRPVARVLEGPVPIWKLRPQCPGPDGTTIWGLPRFSRVTFEARFPFAHVRLSDAAIPLQVTVTGWSPFSPGDADNASLPVAALEYRFENRSKASVDSLFSFNAENFMAIPWDSASNESRPDRIRDLPGGFVLYGPGSPGRLWEDGAFAAWVDEASAKVDYAWPLDSLDVLWNGFIKGQYVARRPLQESYAEGASIFVPFSLAPNEEKTIRLCLAWHVPNSNLFQPQRGLKDGRPITYPRSSESYRPWYAKRFPNLDAVIEYWGGNYNSLRAAAQLFSVALQDSTLPPEVVEAVSANLSILKSPTVLRQTDGRLWGWEGTMMGSAEDDRTGISGTTTHVWNYAQSLPHLFPSLERGLRETEFTNNQSQDGLQYCRTPLPIRPVEPGHAFPDGPAADGQLGGIIKVYREWRISGDNAWLHQLWPRVRASLDYCIRTWDPERRGTISELHLTTYDQELCGADSLCTSLYLGALKAAVLMGTFLNDSTELYSELLISGQTRTKSLLFDGDFFVQKTAWKTGSGVLPELGITSVELTRRRSQEWQALATHEGPIGQYGNGCLSDGVLGEWLCLMAGLEGVLVPAQVKSHLASVYYYNFRRTLVDHPNLGRASFACGDEAGLLVCSWPKDGRPSVPLNAANEVWTGIEYQVASHLVALGMLNFGLEIVRATRSRYDGRMRNPFSEIEAGHWYARAMSSYALLQAFSGARFDAIDRIMYLRPVLKGDFRCFLSTETGFGTVGVKDGQPFVEVVSGQIPYRGISYTPA